MAEEVLWTGFDDKGLYAVRANKDENGNVIHETYATKSELEGKQDVISDLTTIREGAAAGATAVQPGDLATVATSGSYNDLSDKPSIPPEVVVDRDYDPESANAQSGIAVAQAIATVPEQVNADWNSESGVSQILNKPDVIDEVEYDSSNKKILFKAGETLVDEIDATDFIKDGMVDDVKIDNGNLVITFNTDAGKEDITIPLSEIFNPDNYYNKDAVDDLLDDKVDKVEGKQLSTEDYTTAEKTKLAGVETGAQVNVIEGVSVNGSPLIPENKTVNVEIPEQKQADWKENDNSKPSYIKNKPTPISIKAGSGISIVDENDDIVISTEVDASKKADKVLSATDGNFAGLDANGNLTDSGYKADDFATAAQGALADTAVQDASYVHTDNNFTTAEKTKLTNIEDGAEVNVKPDWKATAGSDAEILNKPASVEIVGGTGITVTEDTTNNELVIASTVDVSGKTDKVADPTDGNLAALDATGNLTDSGYKAADFKTKQTAVVDPTASGSAIEFIDTLTQNANGEITATKKSVQTAVASSSGVGGSAGVMSAADKEKLDGVSAGAEANVIDTVKVNGTALTPDAQKAVDVEVPITEIQVNGAAVTPTNHMVDLTIPDAANDGTLSITVGSAQAQTFTADQSTNTTVTVPLAASASGSDPATEGLMSSSDKDKLDHVAKPDWNATSGSDAEILNKPNPISIVAGSGINITEANDTITIAATGTDISGKADKVTGAVSGNFAGLDANGNLADSGSKASDFKTKQTAVVDPTASGSSIEFIDTLAQDANGEITATKKSVQAAVASSAGVGGSAGVMSAADKEKLDGVSAGSEANVIDTVKVNGTALTPDAQKAVDVEVPITEIQVNGTTATPVNHVVDITVPAQVNSDWNATSGVAEILNKPTLATVATTGDYGDLSNAPTLATVATTGDYDDLTNKPTIPAAQVNSDWNAASGVAEILNKPTLATVATTGDYGDLSNAPTLATVATTGDYDDLTNKPTIPAAQVNSDWNASSGVAEILNKPTIGDGTLSITVGSASAQTFTANQSTNSSVTVPLASVDSSGATPVYTEGLMSSTDKEKLEGIEAGAEVNVKPDWEATAGSDAEILNKPASISIVGGTGITVTEDTTNNELVIASTVDVSGKADKAVPATANNFAALNSSGNLADSGYSSSSFATAAQGALADSSIQGITVDSGSPLTPTSGVVNIDLSGKVDKVTGKGLSTNDYDNTDKATVTKAAAVIPSDATASNQLVSYDTMTAALANFIGMKISTGTGTDMHPDEQNPNTKTIYLVLDSSATGNDKYKEWIYSTTNTWTLIGDTTVDLSGYVQYPATHTDTHLVAFGPNESIVDTGETVASLANKVETVSIGAGSGISPTSGTTDINIPLAANNNGTGTDGAMAGADKVKLDSIASGAQVNTVNTVSIGNGSAISPTSGTTDINIPMATSSVDGAMSSTDKGKLDGITAGAEPNVQSNWTEADSTSDAYIANKPDILIPLDSPAAQGGISAPKYIMVVTSMPAAANIDPDTIYLVQGTYIGT